MMYCIFTRLKASLFLVFLALSSICCSCDSEKNAPLPDCITLGTFNMEWFGDNSADDHKPRSEADDKLFAVVLGDIDADVLAVQEVENEQALKRLLQHVAGENTSEYRIALGVSGGKQNVGFLYRKHIELVSVRELEAIAVEKGRTRAGLLAFFRIGGFEWAMLTVHLKSTSRADSTPELVQHSITLRTAQAVEILTFANSFQQTHPTKPLFILGDFNDSPRKKRTTLDTLKYSPNLTFLTEHLVSCSYSGLPGIDHIIASSSAAKRVLRGTIHTVNFRAMLPEKAAERISDHCPVVVQFSPH
jgi:predicted extracellular nuclease